jgi:hypothetical protein
MMINLKLPRPIQAFGAMALMTAAAAAIPVSAQAVERNTPKLLAQASEELVYKAGCYAQGKGVDSFSKVAEYAVETTSYNAAKKLCASKLTDLEKKGVLTSITTEALPDVAKKKDLLTIGKLISLPTADSAEQATTKPTATKPVQPKKKPVVATQTTPKKPALNTVPTPETKKPVTPKGEYTVEAMELNDATTTDFTNARFKGVDVRVPTTKGQAVAFCAQPSQVVDGVFAITEAVTIPKKLAGASLKEILAPKNGVNGITKFYNDCKENANFIFGTTMESVTAINSHGKKVAGYALPRVLPSTKDALLKSDGLFNLNINDYKLTD